MLYIIGFGVFTLITLRIVQASVADRPGAMKAVTIASVVAGAGFVCWLALHAFYNDPTLPPVPASQPHNAGLPKLN